MLLAFATVPNALVSVARHTIRDYISVVAIFLGIADLSLRRIRSGARARSDGPTPDAAW